MHLSESGDDLIDAQREVHSPLVGGGEGISPGTPDLLAGPVRTDPGPE